MSDHNKEIDKLSGVETTGHEWDGLKELNNPLPRWWVYVWVACIIWAFGYWVFYPAWPVSGGHTKGSLAWTEYKELAQSQAKIADKQSAYLAKFKDASYDTIMKDSELHAFAVAGGKALFKNNCAVCHGSGAAGGKGFPNLNDDDWLWGGKISDIQQTISYGIRSGHDEARQSQMPAFGRDQLLEKAQINQVVDYVLTLSSKEGANKALPGADIFANNCAACHGPEGKGGREFGAPNLTDAIWLYGGDRATVYETVYNARSGVMPFWKGKLSDNDIRELTVYVHELGGGEVDEVVPVKAPESPEPQIDPVATEPEKK
jgi:cytochrome c oxidase cbb3-type subunit 3